MSGVRDLFFDEFYAELETAMAEYVNHEHDSEPPRLADELANRWHPYQPGDRKQGEVLVSVDGGVQISRFAYGGFVAVARACALAHSPGEGRRLTKRVKIQIQEVYDNRDRGFIPGYVRMISEYRAAAGAAREVLARGLKPVVLMDGSLYLGRFPYATREYRHHPSLIVELLDSISDLRALARDNGFPLAGISKDSSVFYLHMELLKAALLKAGHPRLRALVDDASNPFDLRLKLAVMEEQDRRALEPFLDKRPFCDSALVHFCAESQGYTQPLLLAPSLYRSGSEGVALYKRLERSLPRETADTVIASLRRFFRSPPVAVTYWKPAKASRPFRVDVAGHSLGRSEPWGASGGNAFLEAPDHGALEGVVDHLHHWYCNDVEYNVPMKQADMLAHFDRKLYTTKYEPFIISRLKKAGVDVSLTRRNQRDM
ncbi:MAG: DNA double-strand break repair nuclease NurA [Candidatus Bathyarchaeia archaeon]